MGEEIQNDHFPEDDFRLFKERLVRETDLLRDYFADGRFAGQDERVGFELEGWLIDRNALPCPVNESFLGYLDDPRVVPELSRFNVEFNSQPQAIGPGLLGNLKRELDEIELRCRRCAEQLGVAVLFIGILPTLRPEMLTLDQLSPLNRYAALNRQILRQRGGRPFHFDIAGEDELILSHGDVMMESATTSLQIHLQVKPERTLRVYNAALLASAPMVALTANSPFLFQKSLWDETRIPLFEQAVDLQSREISGSPTLGRVSFGSGYGRVSMMELFEENLEKFPVLLPILFDCPASELRHLRLHNGTIWRWNRPIVVADSETRCSLRLEHRAIASGPSVVDSVADIAFFIGLMEAWSRADSEPERHFPFTAVQSNFYLAAKHGLDAELDWPKRRGIRADRLLLEELIPAAELGLKQAGVDAGEARYYIREIIAQRVRSKQNGAAWLREALRRSGRDFFAVTQAYLSNQLTGRPVHLWEH